MHIAHKFLYKRGVTFHDQGYTTVHFGALSHADHDGVVCGVRFSNSYSYPYADRILDTTALRAHGILCQHALRMVIGEIDRR